MKYLTLDGFLQKWNVNCEVGKHLFMIQIISKSNFILMDSYFNFEIVSSK